MELSELTARVVALEKSNRRMKLLAGVAITALATVMLGAWQTPQDKVRAKAFEVVDDKGHVLAAMTALGTAGVVTTYNASGNILTDIVETKSGGGGIVAYDGKGGQNLKITDVTGGGGSLVINNSKGAGVLSLGHNTVDAGSVSLLTKDGKVVTLITSDTESSGVLLTYDSAGKQTARVPGGG